MSGRILVVGSSGFVATTLLPKLGAVGYSEFVLVDRQQLAPAVLETLRGSGADVQQFTSDDLLDVGEVSEVVCLAGATSVDAALDDPRTAIAVNTKIALDLAEWMRKYPATRVVYMSSDEVLGESTTPLAEDAPLRPSQPYAASKAAAEVILHNYRDVYGLNLITLRSCNLIGPNQRRPKLIPTAVHSLLRGVPVPIHGTGAQLREWMSVDDLCSAILSLLDSRVAARVYHAASGVHASVLEVVQMVADVLGIPLQVGHVPDRLVQDLCYSMDATELRGLGWAPDQDLFSFLERAVLALRDEVLPS